MQQRPAIAAVAAFKNAVLRQEVPFAKPMLQSSQVVMVVVSVCHAHRDAGQALKASEVLLCMFNGRIGGPFVRLVGSVCVLVHVVFLW